MSEWEQISIRELQSLSAADRREWRVRISTAVATVVGVGITGVVVAGADVAAPTSHLTYDFLEIVGGVIERPALPKPKIPTGLGAVIEIDGERYVLADPADNRQAWLRRRSTSREWVSDTAMQAIANVHGFTVLSEGVSVDE